MNQQQLFSVVQLALWGEGNPLPDRDIYEEMKKQAIAVLPAPYLSQLNLPGKLLREWKAYIFQHLVFYSRCEHEQSVLPISVPYVILKGSAAAQYYPYPEYRVMGDIDIMTRREDLETARRQLLDAGYTVVKELNREICMIKDGISVELHRRFATLNDPEKAKRLDDLIIENINPSHQLPDMINGLVILEHISQHMEGGLGLRQIIDWMMFADKCLPDEKWPEFKVLAEEIGMDTLAVVTTRMCEIYLGLPEHRWCAEANPELCGQLMDYVMLCGNFGNKKTSGTNISENAFAYASTPKAVFTLLQQQGLKNWKAAGKHPFLRPFAWIYQAMRYAFRGLKRDRPVARLRAEYSAGKKRKAMFDDLGVKTVAKGDIIIKDGQYMKK